MVSAPPRSTTTLVLAAGHECLLSAGGGSIGPESDPAALNRTGVVEEPLGEFTARIEGVSLRAKGRVGV